MEFISPTKAVLGLLLFSTLGCGVIGFVNDPAALSGLSYWAAATGVPHPPGVAMPYYRVGTFYMDSDVYVGGPNGLVFRITDHEINPSPRQADASYHTITVDVTNYTGEETLVPMSDLFFVRRMLDVDGALQYGRWVAQNEPLLARNLPAYDAQQLTPISPDSTRTFVIGFVLPNGDVPELGMITNWQMAMEGGLPIWFYLEPDPDGPFVDAHKPPPPTPVVLDGSGTVGGHPTIGGSGRWPTTGIVTRGFGCADSYTGISGAGFGCPSSQPWFHNGVDVANLSGTPIWSPIDGTLIYAGPDSSGADCSGMAGSLPPHEGLGLHQRVTDGQTVHYFGHLQHFLRTNGQAAAGETIAEMGSTGCSTATHLHWIVIENGNLVDPAVWAGPGP